MTIKIAKGINKDVPILVPSTVVTHKLFGKGAVLPRTNVLPAWMTLVEFVSDPTRIRARPMGDGRMAVLTEYLTA